MAGLIIETEPTSEPMTLQQAKDFLRVSTTDDDSLIASLISAAREQCESFCNRSFAIKKYIQTLDSFPYYTDTVMSQMAYPPSYYSLPMYSTTLWNYSQMIKLFKPPVISVEKIEYTKPDNTVGTLLQDVDFLLDNVGEPARIFPKAGQNWPACLYVPDAVRIHFTAGYGSDAGQRKMPARAILAMQQLLANWHENREAAQPGSFSELPHHVQSILWSLAVRDFQPTRG